MHGRVASKDDDVRENSRPKPNQIYTPCTPMETSLPQQSFVIGSSIYSVPNLLDLHLLASLSAARDS